MFNFFSNVDFSYSPFFLCSLIRLKTIFGSFEKWLGFNSQLDRQILMRKLQQDANFMEIESNRNQEPEEKDFSKVIFVNVHLEWSHLFVTQW